MTQILELEATDDIASIKTKIDFALPLLVTQAQQAGGSPPPQQRRRLLLVVPRKNEAMQSLVNMKLLARIVKGRAVDLALVSNQPKVRDYAKAAGLKTFGSLRRANWAGWKPDAAPLMPTYETSSAIVQPGNETQTRLADPALNGEGIAPPAAPPQTSKPKRQKKKKYVVVTGSGRISLWQQLGALVLVLVLAFALVLGFITLLPQATVTLIPVAQPVETELIVRADPDAQAVDFQTLTFPARVDQVELALSGEIETVETELAPTGLAGGAVTFINRTDVTQTISVSVTVSTSAGEQVDFVTVQTATIPAGVGAFTTTQVIATEPGPSGNVRAGQINRFVDSSYALRARVINESDLGGGTMEAARIVVQDDKERLQAHLRQLIQQEGLDQLEARLEGQEFISPETLQVIVLDVSYNEFSGDFSDTFSGEMQAVVRGTVVGGYNANRLALAALEAQVPPGFELDIEGLHFGAGEVLDVQEGVVTFKIVASGRYTPVIDSQEIAQAVAWQPIGEAQAMLDQRYTLATVPGIEVKPAWAMKWLGRLPYYSLRINVIVGDAVTSVADSG
jgi:hypothetical protein